jgi:hypothetical protein
VTNGGTASDQTYLLDPSGWSRLGTKGYRYLGPTGADGDPVKVVILERTLFRTARLKVLLRGGIGTQSLDVVPPAPGNDGGVVLQIGNGGGTYCVAAGGFESRDTSQRWRVVNATGEGCPSP